VASGQWLVVSRFSAEKERKEHIDKSLCCFFFANFAFLGGKFISFCGSPLSVFRDLLLKRPAWAVQWERAEDWSWWQKTRRFRLLGKGGCGSRLGTLSGVSHIV
jgi:hypothetical protein